MELCMSFLILYQVAFDEEELPQVKRTTQEMFKMVKDLLRKKYQAVEQAFYDLDEQNSGKLTHEMMYHLLKR